MHCVRDTGYIFELFPQVLVLCVTNSESFSRIMPFETVSAYLLIIRKYCKLRFSNIHCVPKNVTALSCYNSDTHESILIIFVTNVTKKVGSRKVLYFPTSPN